MKKGQTYSLEEITADGWRFNNVEIDDLKMYVKDETRERIFLKQTGEKQYKIMGWYKPPKVR